MWNSTSSASSFMFAEALFGAVAMQPRYRKGLARRALVNGGEDVMAGRNFFDAS